ncbi:MAG: TlpA family protein disulfide reductase, partial [Cyclobacteriaceae bacterium]|nr:TlpA family protein disulfide reductase [Cyclobacteriaceae bacterium HetDA_MAG_MS6]
LPHFEKANQKEDVQVYLVSLDFVQDLDRVEKFSSKKKLKSKIYLLNEKDYDSYMSKISESWSGAIPATLMIDQDGNRHFYEKAFAENELNMEIDKRMN